MDASAVWRQVDPFYLALLRSRQRRYAECVELCTEILNTNPYDEAVWLTKVRALTREAYVDDTDLEDDGAGDLLMDDNAMASVPRPGTSLSRPSTRLLNAYTDPSVRPISSSGRPISGYMRPGTNSRPASKALTLDEASRGSRPGSTRPATSLGRYVRMGTASLQNTSKDVFLDANSLDLKKYAAKPVIAKALIDYLLYHDHNPRKALELATEATVVSDYKDWFWKSRLGKCYYQLGLLREAEKQFQSSIRQQDMIVSCLELCKIYIRLDQPNTALNRYDQARKKHPKDVHLLLGTARVYDMLGDMEKTGKCYMEVLELDPSNVEAIACLASNYFYTDHPEVAVRNYRRLLQMNINTAELWCNVGLCCFYASLYDMTLSCFDRALSMASDDCLADIWYNIGQVAIGIGDLGLAYQSLKIAVSIDSNHAEARNNLGVLEYRRGNLEHARSNFERANSLADFMFEPSYNRALLAFKEGDFHSSFAKVEESLRVHPRHADSLELKAQLHSILLAI